MSALSSVSRLLRPHAGRRARAGTGSRWNTRPAGQIGEASKVAPVDKLSLVLVALFAFVFLGERPSLREWSGIGCVALGVVILALKR